MGTAYTPGLTVSSGTLIRKTRRLPLKGKVTVSVGDHVTADTVVARTEIPGVIQTVKVAEMLGLEPAEAIAALRVSQGDAVEPGDVLAESRSFFGLFRTECKTPCKGAVELISHATGHVGIRQPSTPIEVAAYVDGVVAEVVPEEGVVVGTYGAFVQGIFGVGGERSGALAIAVESPDALLTEDLIASEHAGAVVVGGAGVTLGALKKAGQVGAVGVVAGAIVDTELIGYLGHDIGIAITGQEDVAATLILTEGFGFIPMAARTFELLESLSGRKVSINGATQIRAGVIRPEIICPMEARPAGAEKLSAGQVLEIGSRVRIIREPCFGELANVTKLPSEPVGIESGAVVRVLEAELGDGRAVTVPRANVEIIEE